MRSHQEDEGFHPSWSLARVVRRVFNSVGALKMYRRDDLGAARVERYSVEYVDYVDEDTKKPLGDVIERRRCPRCRPPLPS